jgi:hypothetical protein
MKLELKHLAHYLPYELKMELLDFPLSKTFGRHFRILRLDCGHDFNHYLSDNKVRPVLRPLSELDWQIIINELHGNMCDAYFDFIDSWHENSTIQDTRFEQMPYEIISILFREHFDVFGLIEKGLAIDINTLSGEAS